MLSAAVRCRHGSSWPWAAESMPPPLPNPNGNTRQDQGDYTAATGSSVTARPFSANCSTNSSARSR
jgi:hypothetical protein